jgi:hypothetical protein
MSPLDHGQHSDKRGMAGSAVKWVEVESREFTGESGRAARVKTAQVEVGWKCGGRVTDWAWARTSEPTRSGPGT